jgi:shikimate dehydrogenase
MIDGKTTLTGIIGWPVSHSYSPAMHNAAAAALGLDLVYVPLPVRPDRLAYALRGLVALGFRGVNVTLPHKEAVLPYLDQHDTAAQTIGAVNTIVIKDERLAGYNTDWSGFLADIEGFVPELKGRECLVLGAGGAARAVVYALIQRGAQVSVYARRTDQAEQLAAGMANALPDAEEIRIASLGDVTRHASGSKAVLIVNTTPLGMAGEYVEASPLPEGVPLPSAAFVYDLVYNPARTRLMRQAEASGCQTANGLGMLVGQAAEAFKLFTGLRPDPLVMLRAIAQHHS